MTAARILVTGGTGTIGSHVVQMLIERDVKARLLVRNPEKAAEAAEAGFEIVRGDLAERASLNRAVECIRSVLLISAPDERQRELHSNAIAAAREAKVQHVVRVSAFGADENAPIFLARSHGESERELESSGMAYTHIRPHLFMQNFFGYIPTIHTYGCFYGCLRDARLPMVDARDIAAVCVEALTGKGHEGKTYELTGPEAFSMPDAAEVLSDACGEPIRYVDLPPDQLERGMRDAGVPDWLAHDLTWLYSNVFALGQGSEVSDAVARVTGRKPFRFAEFARDYADRFRKPAA
ncbi:MAG: SDR family oxidoreductase [Acidobacteria bacterium]|nr:SDR family oxidoreductase [Acidobacteriota bacterium]